VTGWKQATDKRDPKDNRFVSGRMIEMKMADGTWLPAIEHKIEASEPPSRDSSYTWAVESKLSSKDWFELTARFPDTFSDYKDFKARETTRELELQAKVEAEVARKMATNFETTADEAKAKKPAGK
jgi:hypothetical protein